MLGKAASDQGQPSRGAVMVERHWTAIRCSICVPSASDVPKSRGTPREHKGRFEPPDAEHDWVTGVQAAEILGVSTVAVNKRCRRGRLPFVEKAGRRWFRAIISSW